MPPKKPNQKDDLSDFKQLAFRASIDMVSAIIIGVGVGYFGDMYWSYAPLGILIGFCFGAAAGFLNVYRGVKKLQDTDSERL